MPSKTNLIHRHKLIMNNIIGHEDSKGTFHGGQNYNIIRAVYRKQKPLILRYVRSRTPKMAIEGLPLFFKVNFKPMWSRALKQVWLNSAEEAEDFVKEHHNPVKKGEEIIQKDYQEYADEWMDQHAGTKINGITDTDQEWLANTLRSGVSEGKTQNEIADDLVDDFDNVSEGRAATIARTETNGAFSYASNETAKDLMPEGATKTWNTTSSAPRPAHEDADGQTVALSDSFDIGGEDLDYPSDPNGSDWNTINCLCVITYDYPSESEVTGLPVEEFPEEEE